MLVFIIPVKSISVSHNWQLFCALFERTLRSACNQKNDNYRVVVVCHEIPEIDFKHPKIEYHRVDFTVPHTTGMEKGTRIGLFDADKSRKIFRGLEIAIRLKASFVMTLDSDDCVSNRLVDFIEKEGSDGNGWYMKKGYIYREWSKLIFLNRKNFNTLCGSSIITKPEFLPYLFHKENPLYYSHSDVIIKEGIKLTPFPFPAVIYSIANEENILMSKEQTISYTTRDSLFSAAFIKGVLRKATKYRPLLITPGFRKEFGLTKINT
jgi:hypothetical protein